ncbi:MAG: VOC family protein [Proteobacteria bacterium]|nr:VOC family protein [Pseudomonadota bacterium]
MQEPRQTLVPLLIVKDAISAIDFYRRVFGARELVRYMNNVLGTISHADLMIGETLISVTEEAPGWNSDAPGSLGGSPVVLQLCVDDVDVQFKKACAEGATVVFPVANFCGDRMGRLRDPFGHLWILMQRIEELSAEDQQRCRDALFSELLGRPQQTTKTEG